MYYRAWTLIIGLLVLSLVNISYADEFVVAKQLIKKLADIEDYQARFTQVTYASDGQVLQRQQGLLQAARPNQFYWAIEDSYQSERYQQVIISDGTQVWIIDHDLEQITVQPLNADVSNTPALLFSGDLQDIQQRFLIKPMPLSSVSDQLAFELEPKHEQALFQSLTLVFSKAHLVKMTLLDHLDQKTFLEFSKGQLNQTINRAIFTPQIPPGYDLIEQVE